MSKVISFRVDEETYKIWKRALEKRRKEVRKAYPEADVYEARVFKDLMRWWAKNLIK